MANLGYVSSFNINGNELSLKDAALTEIVEEIIEAIGANNGDISERINNLHDRSFDALIKISSQNESEISNIQDGIYKIQYITVTGSGDNATETLNDSAILIQKGTNQYLYKDSIISSRTKENNTWGNWEANSDSGFETIECGSDFDHVPGTFRTKSRGYYLLHWYSYDSENDWTDENLLLVYYNGNDWIYVPSIDTNSYYNVLFYYDENVNYFKNYTESDEYKTIKIGNDDVSEQLQSKFAMTYQDFTDWLTQIGLIIQKEETDSETGDLITRIGTIAENLIYRLDWAVLSYSNNNYDENEYTPNDPVNGINGGLDPRIRNLEYLKWTPDVNFSGLDGVPSVGDKKVMGIYFVLNENSWAEYVDYVKTYIDSNANNYIDINGIYPNQIIDICILEIETISSYNNYMYLKAYNCKATEYLLFDNKKRTVNFSWDNTDQLYALDFRNVEWTDYDYFSKNISYPVTSVNGQTGAVTITHPVTSVNGMTGAVVLPEGGVTSFNGATGAVTYTAPVTSVNGMTGAVTVNVPVTSVNGQTGAVSLSIPDAQIQADWNQTITTAKDYIKNKPTIPTVPTTSTTVTENDTNPVSGGAVYAKFEDLIGSAPAALDTLEEIATALNNDADLAGTLTNQITGKISKVSPATAGNFAALNSDGTLSDSGHKHSDYLTEAPVTSVNGMTGAVTVDVPVTSVDGKTGAVTITHPVTSVNGQTGAVNINVGVTSFNGSTGAVTYTAPVTSVNGATGAVTVNVPVTSVDGQTGAVTINHPVTSVNGQTGAVSINVGVTSFNGATGAVTYTAHVTSVNGATGAVTVNGLPAVTSADNGKVLMVVNGVWTLVSPVTLYSGSGTPANSQGNNGDLYIQS